MSAPRFEAEWITAQVVDEFGDWNPDDDTYAHSTHATLEAAQAAATAGSKAAGIVEWCRVAEYHFNPELGIPARSEAAWDTVRIWHGDWDGNFTEGSV